MASELWCTILNMGEWDLIFEESLNRQVCEMFIEINGYLFDTPLEVKLKPDVRKVPKELIDIIKNPETQIPQK